MCSSNFNFFKVPKQDTISSSTSANEKSLVVFILIPFVCVTLLIVLTCSVYICMKRRQIHRRDPERMAVVGAENPDDITMQSLNNSLAEDYSISDLDMNRRSTEHSCSTPNTDDTIRDDLHLEQNNSTPSRGRARFNTHIGFLSSNHGVDEDTSPRADLNWRKFSNGSVQVIYRN